MKINVEIDVSPEELRRFFGLADVQEVQNEMLKKLKEHMEKGMDSGQVGDLAKQFMDGSFQSMETFQRMFSNFMDKSKK